MDLAHFTAELKRRRVFRALVGYGIAAFAVLQIIEPVMHGLHWSDAVLSYVVVALAAGFPIVVALAWVFDVRDGGIERTPAASGALRGTRLALLLVGVGVLAGAPGLIWNFFLRRPAQTSVERSIAVLPLTSAGDETGYFAQGIHDELLRQLASVTDLQVISRTSVLQYRDGARNLRDIGEALGVASILEGSVQRVGNRVRVEVKLIDARTDRQLWAERYDRDATDVFAIETAVAEEIVRALHARLLPEQKARLERKPTRSPEAYDHYLRGLEYFNRPGWRPENMEIAAKFFQKALDDDGSFALARARLALVLLNRLWWRRDVPNAVAEIARVEAERSLQLSPDLPEGHLAMGYYHYYGHRDYEPALKQFELARQGNPAEATAATAYIFRRLGRLDEAARRLETAARLDPQSSIPLELARTLFYLRRYEEAEHHLQRLLEFAPDVLVASALKAAVRAAWKGEIQPVTAVLRQLRGRAGEAALGAGLVFLLDLDPREALAIADSLESDGLVAQTATYPKAFLRAVAHEATGERALAFREYSEAVPALEAEVAKRPDSGYQRALLARAYAGLGRKQDALRAADLAVSIMPVSADALSGPFIAIDRARVEARVGENAAALGHIRELLAIPCALSPSLLRVDPTWSSLRSDPRFRQLAGQ